MHDGRMLSLVVVAIVVCLWLYRGCLWVLYVALVLVLVVLLMAVVVNVC